MNTTQFGNILDQIVRRKGLSMKAVAKNLGIPASTLSRFRTGRRQPRSLDWNAWTRVLSLSEVERRSLEAALISQAEVPKEPLSLHDHHLRAQRDADARLMQGGWYDGCWLAMNHCFTQDGLVQRTLVRIRGDKASWINRQGETIRYSYHGSLHLLRDKLFILLEEERVGSEFVQVSLHALFDQQHPVFLYGLVSGVSGTDLHRLASVPCAARILLVKVGAETELAQRPELQCALDDALGTVSFGAAHPWWPSSLGSDSAIRNALGLRARDDLDASIDRLLDNHVPQNSQVLRAVMEHAR